MTLNDAIRMGIIGTDGAEVCITLYENDGRESYDFILGFGWIGARDKDDAEDWLNDAASRCCLGKGLPEDCVNELWDKLQDILTACWNRDLDWLAENNSNNSIIFHGDTFGFYVDVSIDGLFF